MPLPTQHIWHQSPTRTIYRFENGFGASLVKNQAGSAYSFAPLKFTTDPLSSASTPFFIHYATPLGQPRTNVQEDEIPNLLGQIQGYTDDIINDYSKQIYGTSSKKKKNQDQKGE